MLLLMLAQAALQAAPPATDAPAGSSDIQLDARVTAREVRIERSGEASLEVSGGPGSDVRVEAPEAEGRRRLRNVEVRVRAEARVAEDRQNPESSETDAPQ